MHKLLKEYVHVLLEKTRWKEEGIDFDSLADLKKWVNKGAYVTFTEINKVGINPQFAYTHPLGIWTYPLNSQTFEEIIKGTVRFAGNRPYIQIVKPRIPGAMLDFDNLSIEQVDKLLGDVEQITGVNVPEKVLKVSHPGERLEKAVKIMSGYDVKKQTSIYRHLGFEGLVLQKKNLAAFFTKNAIKHVDMVLNPARTKRQV